MDTATGLLYLGNGQYYNPQTGRFLSRDARPDQGNPYIPWQGNPGGALITPLALLVLIYGRKRKRSKWDMLVILLVLGASMGMSLSACNGKEPTEVSITFSPDIPPAITITPIDSSTTTATPTYDPGQGTEIPTVTCKITFTPINTPMPTPTDDELHLTLEEFPYALDMVNHLKFNESDSLVLARLAIGEGAQGNQKDQEYVMWTVRIRAAIGFNNYNAGDYKKMIISPTDIKTEMFSTRGKSQYQSMTGSQDSDNPNNRYYLGLITLPDGPIFGMAGQDCTDAKRRMANPCNEEDTRRLRDAYNKAQEIISKDIMQAPKEIWGYESFESYEGQRGYTKFCDFGDYEPPYTKPGEQLLAKGNIYKDCVLLDNILFGLPSPIINP